jgi:hypothetical protein
LYTPRTIKHAQRVRIVKMTITHGQCGPNSCDELFVCLYQRCCPACYELGDTVNPRLAIVVGLYRSPKLPYDHQRADLGVTTERVRKLSFTSLRCDAQKAI